MKFGHRLTFLILAIVPIASYAQYDYNDDFTKAIAAHYPPLVRLLITKGAKQNTQDARGDTPLMLSIRSSDREMADLLMHYQPNLSLLNAANHSAATEAVLADDPDSLQSVLVREDQLQVAQSVGLATKLKKRRVLNKFSEILGAPVSDEIGHFFLDKPLQYFALGSQVAFEFSPAENRPELCGKPTSRFLLQGKICKVDGERITVEWQSLSNLNNDDMQCSNQRHFRVERRPDNAWNASYLGACGVPPTYFSSVPSLFDYRQFVIPELK